MLSCKKQNCLSMEGNVNSAKITKEIEAASLEKS